MRTVLFGVGFGLALAGGVSADSSSITLQLKKYQSSAAFDESKVWPEQAFVKEGSPAHLPDIYIAKAGSPYGTFFLSQITSGCSLQSDCPFKLEVIGKNGQPSDLASGYMTWGGLATITDEFRTLIVETYDGDQRYKITPKIVD